MRRVGSWVAAAALLLPLALSTSAAALRADLFARAGAEPKMACCRTNKNCCCRNRAGTPKITNTRPCDAPCAGASLGVFNSGLAALPRTTALLAAPSMASALLDTESTPVQSVGTWAGGARSPPSVS